MDKVREAEALVKALETERSKLLSRIAELDAERGSCPVDRLSRLGSELGACQSTLDVVVDRLTSARVALRDARQEAKDVAVNTLRPREAKAFDVVVDRTLALRDALRGLDDVRQQVVALGGSPIGGVRQVEGGVRQQVEAWRFDQSFGGYGAGKVKLTFDD